MASQKAGGWATPYKFNGKELDDETGMYYYGMRYYDPAIGKWLSTDPRAEMYPSMSPYNFVGNNPIAFIDMKGDSISPYTIRATTPTQKPSDKLTNPIAKLGMEMVESAVEGVNYMVRSPFYGRGEGVPKVFEDGHTIKGSEESQTMAVDGLMTVAPIVGRVVKPAAASTKGEITVYRVFGGDSRAQGFSWTRENPSTIQDFRNVAGLPSGGASGATNTADFMIKGRVNINDVINTRPALPLDGNKGGLLEFIINPKNVRITDVKVLKP